MGPPVRDLDTYEELPCQPIADHMGWQTVLPEPGTSLRACYAMSGTCSVQRGTGCDAVDMPGLVQRNGTVLLRTARCPVLRCGMVHMTLGHSR
eukprot:3941961-Rhodomonas_salina.9